MKSKKYSIVVFVNILNLCFSTLGEDFFCKINLTSENCGLDEFACSPIEFGELYLVCFRRNGKSERFVASFSGANQFLDSNLYSTHNNLVVYTHGFFSNFLNYQSKVMRDAHLKRENTTFCAVDAADAFAFPNYVRAARNVKCVGEMVSSFLYGLYHGGFNANQIQVIGHSLGAQALGYLGRDFQCRTNGTKLGRVTALDPARQCFEPHTHLHSILPTDAKLVDVYHCNAGCMGITNKVGQADFFPNCGTFQNGCIGSVCSHERCIYLYVSSLIEAGNCATVESESCDTFTVGENSNKMTLAGNQWDGTTGTFYYVTSNTLPFCKPIDSTHAELSIVST